MVCFSLTFSSNMSWAALSLSFTSSNNVWTIFSLIFSSDLEFFKGLSLFEFSPLEKFCEWGSTCNIISQTLTELILRAFCTLTKRKVLCHGKQKRRFIFFHIFIYAHTIEHGLYMYITNIRYLYAYVCYNKTYIVNAINIWMCACTYKYIGMHIIHYSTYPLCFHS